jgi:hypothetical protein
MHGDTVLWLGLSLLSSVSKANMWSYYGWVCCYCRSSVNTIHGRIMVGIVAVVISQYYDCVCNRCHISVNTICGGIMVRFVVVLVCQ